MRTAVLEHEVRPRAGWPGRATAAVRAEPLLLVIPVWVIASVLWVRADRWTRYAELDEAAYLGMTARLAHPGWASRRSVLADEGVHGPLQALLGAPLMAATKPDLRVLLGINILAVAVAAAVIDDPWASQAEAVAVTPRDNGVSYNSVGLALQLRHDIGRDLTAHFRPDATHEEQIARAVDEALMVVAVEDASPTPCWAITRRRSRPGPPGSATATCWPHPTGGRCGSSSPRRCRTRCASPTPAG